MTLVYIFIILTALGQCYCLLLSATQSPAGTLCYRKCVISSPWWRRKLSSGSFPGGSDGKESASTVWGLGLIPGLGRSPGEGNGYPLQCSCLEKPQGQRSLVGYRPWGHKESNTTEWVNTFTFSANEAPCYLKAIWGRGIIPYRWELRLKFRPIGDHTSWTREFILPSWFLLPKRK